MRGRPNPIRDEAVYLAWRARFPWTGDQIADAVLQAKAADPRQDTSKAAWYMRVEAWARAGHLSKQVLGIVLPFLVRTCSAPGVDGSPCGRKALYRIGIQGRCSRHRDVAEAFEVGRRSKLDGYRAAYDRDLNDKDRTLRAGDRLRALGRSGKQKGMGRRK